MSTSKPGDIDLDSLFQRPPGPTQEEYLEKLQRERKYLEEQIGKLANSDNTRASLICSELREALKESIESKDLLERGEFIGALAMRDRMHIRLHQTKGFQWLPLLKRAEKFKPGRTKGAIGAAMTHIQKLVEEYPELKAKELRALADESILSGMAEGTFANQVTNARKRLR